MNKTKIVQILLAVVGTGLFVHAARNVGPIVVVTTPELWAGIVVGFAIPVLIMHAMGIRPKINPRANPQAPSNPSE
jgi:hypothetical protein